MVKTIIKLIRTLLRFFVFRMQLCILLGLNENLLYQEHFYMIFKLALKIVGEMLIFPDAYAF